MVSPFVCSTMRPGVARLMNDALVLRTALVELTRGLTDVDRVAAFARAVLLEPGPESRMRTRNHPSRLLA